MAEEFEDFGTSLAPEDDMYEVLEEEDVIDPLDEGNQLIIDGDTGLPSSLEGSIPPTELSGLTDFSIAARDDLMGDLGDEIEDEVEEDEVDFVEILEDDELEDESLEVEDVEDELEDESLEVEDVEMEDVEDELNNESFEVNDIEDEIDYGEPGPLIASILDRARKFASYDMTSQNSIRRASALCNELEKAIIEGVTKDAKQLRLSLAQLRLLDDLEEGIHYTRSHLECFNNKKQVFAKSTGGDSGLQSGMYDPFCAAIARVLINAQVQGGKKIQDVFQKLQEKYSIDKREQFQITQILSDLGYPVRSLIDGEDMIDQYYA